MQSRVSIDVDRPIAQVFEYTNENLSEWSLTCVEDEVIEEKNGGGVGTTFRVVTEEKGRRMEFTGTVTRYDVPTHSACFLVGDHFDIDVSYTYEDLGESRTRVTIESNVTGKGFVRVMFFLFGWLMKSSGCKAQENELTSLKRHCEEAIPA